MRSGYSATTIRAVAKAAGALAVLRGCVAWFWGQVEQRVEGLELSEEGESQVYECLLGGLYWQAQGRRERQAEERLRLQALGRLSDTNSTLWFAHFMLSLLFICIELLPVFMKTLLNFSPATAYDKLAAAIEGLGDDVTVEGRGGYTPFVRGRQFAAVAAATRDRVDLGLRFADPPADDRLQPSTGPGQATHKIALHSVGDVDDRVLHLLRLAYEQSP